MPRRPRRIERFELRPPGGGIGGPGGQTVGSDITRALQGTTATLLQRLEKHGEASAKQAGISEGAAALAEGRAPDTKSFGFFKDIYNDAALQTHVAGLLEKGSTAVQQAALEAGGDPDAYRKLLQKSTTDLLAQSAPEVRDALKVRLGIQSEAGMRAVLRQGAANLDAEREVNVTSALNSSLRDIGRFARAGEITAADAATSEADTLLLMARGGVMPENERKRTQLTAEEEKQFQADYVPIAERLGLDKNPDNPLHRYDWRGAWKAGEMKPNAEGHFSSRYKDPDHPNRFVMEGGQRIDSITGRPVPNGILLDQVDSARPLLTPAQEVSVRERIRFARAANFALGDFERQQTLAGKKESLARFKKKPGDLGQEEVDRISDYMQREIDREESAIATQRVELRNAAEEDASAVIAKLDAGLKVDHDTVVATRQRLANYPDLSLDLSAAERRATTMAKIARATFKEGRAIVDALGTSAQTKDDVAFYTHAQQAYALHAKARIDDPISEAMAVGIVDDVKPLDLNSLSSVKERNDVLKRIEAAWPDYGPVGPMTPTETSVTTNLLETASVDEHLNVMHNMLEGFGKQRFLVAARDVQKKGLPLVSIAMDVLADRGPESWDTARDILLGPKHANDAKLAMGEAGELDEAIKQYVGTAYMADPDYSRAMQAAIKAHYMTSVARNGATRPDYDALKRSEKLVTGGGLVEYNGEKTVPPHGMSQKDFDAWMDTIDGDYIDLLGGVMATEGVGSSRRAAALLHEGGQLMARGPDEWAVMVDHARLGRGFLLAPDGSRFILRWVVPPKYVERGTAPWASKAVGTVE